MSSLHLKVTEGREIRPHFLLMFNFRIRLHEHNHAQPWQTCQKITKEKMSTEISLVFPLHHNLKVSYIHYFQVMFSLLECLNIRVGCCC